MYVFDALFEDNGKSRVMDISRSQGTKSYCAIKLASTF